MFQFNPQRHHRRSIRLKGYDYSKEGYYFITICCEDKAKIFGEIIDGKMILNEFGQIANQEWLNTANIRQNCKLHAHIIMPDHIHGIIEILFSENPNNQIGAFKSTSQTIGAFIRGFKIATIKRIKDFILLGSGESKFDLDSGESKFASVTGELQFAPTFIIKKINFKIWQRNYYEIIIRDELAYLNIARYIRNNPKNHKTKRP
jgi:REP element-mobilizing transposase RayT